jgi:transcription initiation factor TFIIH subunit 2
MARPIFLKPKSTPKTLKLFLLLQILITCFKSLGIKNSPIISKITGTNLISMNSEKKLNNRTTGFRNVAILVDLSEDSSESDFKPSRCAFSISSVISFTENFFQSNILSFLSIFIINDSNCIAVSKTNNDPQVIKNDLLSLKFKPLGSCTLFTSLNSIITSMSQCSFTPFFEIGIILSSACVVDFSVSVYEALLNSNAAINCFSFVGEIEILKQLCVAKRGFFKVANLFDSLSFKFPYNHEFLQSSMKLRTNFAYQTMVKNLCSCHNNYFKEAFICNRCFNSLCSVPSFCPICNCFTVTSNQIQMYVEIQNRSFSFSVKNDKILCEFCGLEYARGYSCESCSSLICIDCVSLITETVMSCPKCAYQR